MHTQREILFTEHNFSYGKTNFPLASSKQFLESGRFLRGQRSSFMKPDSIFLKIATDKTLRKIAFVEQIKWRSTFSALINLWDQTSDLEFCDVKNLCQIFYLHVANVCPKCIYVKREVDLCAQLRVSATFARWSDH